MIRRGTAARACLAAALLCVGGAFVLSSATAGRWHAFAGPTNRRPVEVRPAANGAPADGEDGRALGHAAKGFEAPPLRWTVLALGTDEPVAGAHVVAPASEAEEIAITGPDGSFELAASDSDCSSAHGFVVRHSEFHPLRVSSRDVQRWSPGTSTLFLTPLGCLEVEVRTTAGIPVESEVVEYTLRLRPARPEVLADEVISRYAPPTRADGVTRIESIPCGAAITVCARRESTFVVVDPRLRRATVRLTVPGAGEIRGRFVRTDDAPAAGVGVSIDAQAALDPLALSRASSNRDGTFAFKSVRAGKVVIDVDEPGTEPVIADVREGECCILDPIVLPEVAPFEVRLVSRFELDPRSFQISLLRLGERLANGPASEENTFRVELPTGDVLVIVEQWRGSECVEVARAGDSVPNENATISVDGAAGAIAAMFSEPIAEGEGVDWTLFDATRAPHPGTTRREPLYRFRAKSSGGCVRSPAITSGRYDVGLRVGAEGVFVRGVDVQAGLESSLSGLAFGRCDLAGSVVDARGREVEGASVTLSCGEDRRTTRTRALGTFRFEGVPPGPWLVEAEHGAFGVSPAASIEGSRASVDRVVLRLEPFAAVRGRITRGEAPVSGLPIGLQRTFTNRTWSETSDESGRFAFLDVRPGAYAVSARGFGVVPIEVKSGEQQEVRFDLADDPVRELSLAGAGDIGVRIIEANVVCTDRNRGTFGRRLPMLSSGEELARDRIRVALPNGSANFVALLECSGRSGGVIVAPFRRADVEAGRIEVPSGELIVRSAGRPADDVAPAAYLLAIDGTRLSEVWPSRIALVRRTLSGGGWRFVGIPPSSEILLVGYDGEGRAVRKTLSGVDEMRSVDWP